MNFVEESEPGAFVVDFRALQSIWSRVRRASVVVDPFSVGRVLDEVMQCSTQRAVNGRPLVWNEYKVFLAPEDHEGLAAFKSLHRDLERVLAKRLHTMEGEIVGSRMFARLLIDEAGDVQPGQAVVRVSFVDDDSEVGAPAKGEVTVRFRPDREGTVTDGVTVPNTNRVLDPDSSAETRVRVIWRGGDCALVAGRRYEFGRPHDSAPAGFVPLNGAGSKISRRHLWIEVLPDQLQIGRPSDANPVQLDGTLIPAGRHQFCEDLPVTISLSRGAFELRLEEVN